MVPDSLWKLIMYLNMPEVQLTDEFHLVSLISVFVSHLRNNEI